MPEKVKKSIDRNESASRGQVIAARISDTCRLCGSEAVLQFHKKILRKLDAQYYKCENCCSLQIETPYWLEEAYKHNLSNLDTGAAQRNLNTLAACYVACKLFGLKNAVDCGGGDGLLCRLLRDYEINCFVKDKYAQPTYAQGFTQPNFTSPDLILGFELWEHFSNPATEIDVLLGKVPKPSSLARVSIQAKRKTGGIWCRKAVNIYSFTASRPSA